MENLINIPDRVFRSPKFGYVIRSKKPIYLSRGSFNRREGFSKFNKIYEFKAAYDGAQADFVMTSASGHIQNYEFPIQYKKWDNISPGALFNAQE